MADSLLAEAVVGPGLTRECPREAPLGAGSGHSYRGAVASVVVAEPGREIILGADRL